jgi:hypothetical protein
MRLFSVVIFAFACSNQKPAADDDFSDLQSLDQKSDAFSSKMRNLGALDEGQTRKVYYTSSPLYRGYTLDGSGPVDLWVRSTTGDAVAWLLDSKFHIVKKNDDAGDTTYDAHLAGNIPADATLPWYLVMRDYDKTSGWFSVERGSQLACDGSGRIGTIPDECIDDGGANGVGDSLEIYCFKGTTRFCLSGESCPWRDHLPRTDDGRTCSHAGLGVDGSGETTDHDYMANAWCQEWNGHARYICSPDGHISFR